MLKKLTLANGVSGCEAPVREIIINEIEKLCTELKTDQMGNVLAFKKGKKPNGKKVLLSAHMDEVGFIITDITEEGYLKFASVGGIDPKVLISQRVTVNGISGVIGLKAVHLTDKEERNKKLSERKLFIDIGAASKAEAERWASKGDYAAFDSDYIEFGDMIKAKALDDRLGCAVLIDILKGDYDIDIYCSFTVQEEVGLRGSAVAAKGLCPDFALVIEGTTCNDLAKVPENLRVTKCGGGAAVSVLDSASKADAELVKILLKIAEKRGIPHQIKASTAGGNDAGSISLADGGIRTASISVPCRYIHSPVSVMNKKDFEACRALTEEFLRYVERTAKIC